MSERALIERAAHGDGEALEGLVAAHRPAAYRIARGILGDHDAADDVAQDAMVRLAAALPGFRAESELGTWVYRVTLNLCRDELRRRRRRAADVTPEDAAGAPQLERRPDPQRTLDAERAAAAVREAVARLPDEQREALTLRYLSELPYAEIARVTETPQGTVASRVFRALKRLGEELEPRHMEILR